MAPVRYRTTSVDGFKVFFREAGSAGAPKLCCCMAFRAQATCFVI
jgi:hypothetical protein